MGWAQYNDPSTGLTQWVDADKAAKWFARLAAITTNAELVRLDGAGWASQMAAVQDAWQALSWAFQALNLPALAQPYYVLNSIQWLGRVTGTDQSSARLQTVNHLVLLSPVQNDAVFGQRIIAWWPTIGGTPFNNDNTLCGVYVRINLTSESKVATTCISADGVHDRLCDFGNVASGCSNGPGIRGCEQPRDALGTPALCTEPDCLHYNWHTMAWDSPPAAPFAAGAQCRVTRLTPPLRWSMEQLQDLAARYTSQTPLETVAQALRWAAVSNIAQAANAGILPGQLADANAALTRQYNATVAAQRAGLAAYGAAIGALVGAVTVNPIAGTAVGAALAALAAIAPIAAGCDEDFFGRCKPVMEAYALTARQPTVTIPDPFDLVDYLVQHPSLILGGIPLQTVTVKSGAPGSSPAPNPPNSPPPSSGMTGTEAAGLAIGGATVLGLIALAWKGKI